MRGNNSLLLCEAQMITIVQEWIDRNFATKPKVTCVSRASSGSGARDTFEVSLTDPPVRSACGPLPPGYQRRQGAKGPEISDMTGSSGI